MDQQDRGFELINGVIHTRANAGEEMPTPDAFADYLTWAIRVHTRFALPDKRFRKFDRLTPIIVHPLHCMSEIMQEPRLSPSDRAAGGLALLGHDILEDTTVRALPPVFFSPRVCELVSAMTFPGGSEQEMEEIWMAEPFVWLCKLYDKSDNWRVPGHMSADKRQIASGYLCRLLIRVVEVYGEDLHIVKIARALIAAG